jgi:tRNA(Met) C34 N-acetyltransferase TmcA
MQKAQLCRDLALGTMNIYRDLPVQRLESLLEKADREVFLQLREKEITFKQFESRVLKRAGIANYMVLDDILDEMTEKARQALLEQLKTKKPSNKPIAELLRPLHPWEVDPHCRRSLQPRNPSKKPKPRQKLQPP